MYTGFDRTTLRNVGSAGGGCAGGEWSGVPEPGRPGDEPGVPGTIPQELDVRAGILAGRGASLNAAGRARLVADGGGLENRYGVKPIVGSNPTPSAPSSGLRWCDGALGSLTELSARVVPAACPYGSRSCPPRGDPAVPRPRRLVALLRAGGSSLPAMRSGRPAASPRRAWLRSGPPASGRHGGGRAGGRAGLLPAADDHDRGRRRRVLRVPSGWASGPPFPRHPRPARGQLREASEDLGTVRGVSARSVTPP